MAEKDKSGQADSRVLMKQQFNESVDIYKGLLGNLYPALVYDKLQSLRLSYLAAGGNPEDVVLPNPPNAQGYVR